MVTTMEVTITIGQDIATGIKTLFSACPLVAAVSTNKEMAVPPRYNPRTAPITLISVPLLYAPLL